MASPFKFVPAYTALLPAALLAAAILPAQAPQTNALAPRPKLIVVIVVDQMRADYVERFRSRWHGGLRRMLDQGSWLSNAAYPYAATETCPGHATVSTGVFPAAHGIVANAWWDRRNSARVTCTEDSGARKVGRNSVAASPGDSAVRLLAPTFAEQLRNLLPGSRTVTLSVKARSAVMLAGRQADASLWIDESTGAVLTSTAYGAQLPAFAREFVSGNPVSADFSKAWQLSEPASSYSVSRSVAGEGPPSGWTTSFPHRLSANDKTPGPSFVQRWRTSPFADLYLNRLAGAAIDGMKLGQGSGVDYLAIGFSATDYIGHSFGPDSREIEDDLLVLDKTIGALLDKLDRSIGAGRYIVALTADHGVAPIPEQASLQGRDAGRTDPRDVASAVEKALSRALGAGRYVSQFIAPDLYLAPGATARLDSDPALWRATQQAVLAVPGVANVVRRPARAPVSDASDLTRALALDFYPERSGDVWIGLKPNWFFGTPSLKGTTHGSAYLYDQRVPIILFGKGIKHGRFTEPATPADIAPTLAAVTAVRIARTNGRIVREVLTTPPAAARARLSPQ